MCRTEWANGTSETWYCMITSRRTHEMRRENNPVCTRYVNYLLQRLKSCLIVPYKRTYPSHQLYCTLSCIHSVSSDSCQYIPHSIRLLVIPSPDWKWNILIGWAGLSLYMRLHTNVIPSLWLLTSDWQIACNRFQISIALQSQVWTKILFFS